MSRREHADAYALAEQIAALLFTNGRAERAQRLVLTIDKPVKRDLGGWSERGAVNQIARAIVEFQRVEQQLSADSAKILSVG